MNLEQLINTIKELNGNKIITLSNFEKQQSWVYGCLDDGVIGSHEEHELLFKAQLLSSMCNGGSIIIRQFTSIWNNGKPVKKLYGLSLGKNNCYPVTAKALEVACCTDAETGNRISKEENVVFAEFRIKERD